MKKALLHTLLFIFFFSCHNSSENNTCKIYTYTQINEFVKQVIESDTTKTIFEADRIYNSLSSTSDLFEIEDLDDFIKLSENDIKSMKLQDSIFRWAPLHPEIFHEYELVDDDTKTGFYRTYSVPLLSLDERYLIIKIGYDVGFLSGRGYLIIFENIDDNWVEKHRFFMWIS